MKKLLLIVAVIVTLSGCNYPTTRFFATDYTQYNEHGFFVSPLENIEGYKFMPISSIMLQESHMKAQYVYRMLDKLVDFAKEKGADGLIGVKFSIELYSHSPVWCAEGIAVKFIDGSPATGKPLAVYNYEAARSFTRKTKKPLTTWHEGENGREFICYDPDSNTYLTGDKFIIKYGSFAYYRLQELQYEEKTGQKPMDYEKERGQKPMDYDAGKWDY